MKNKKLVLLGLGTTLLLSATAIGTIAYLTDREDVVNTFTVGNVGIELDEEKVNPDGTPTPEDDERVKENEYHLIPGQTYVKDPTITVTAGSEASYVRMLVTVNCYSQLQSIFDGNFLPQYFVSGWDFNTWVSTNIITTDDVANTATYEFRYYDVENATDIVDASQSENDIVLDALFDSLTVPSTLTGDDLALLSDNLETTEDESFKITVNGHAIQALGFENADEAWIAFEEQMK